MTNMNQGISTDGNRAYRATYRSGLIGVLAGESLAKAIDRILATTNADGQRLVFMVKDRWSIWRWLGAILVFAITIGFVGRSPGYLLITEPKPDQPRQNTEPQNTDRLAVDAARQEAERQNTEAEQQAERKRLEAELNKLE